MTTLVYLIPAALFLGALGLSGFLWALRSGQYEDLHGAAERILIDRNADPDRCAEQPAEAPSQLS
ncbi:cbb3-type cytochrome oxidase assembly protein CcoS [Mesorhizobium silamurunense]|uniref:cbb3-type cytochrome oxidase assembly protein CcoS n=1 Tax=Mesorhizobium silamurunense TaxID=499528 RepID=UPI001782C74C|nr:cbb3-type cytochrome oxidase assembly protein CcoS [Mesorhizobium silamurunense]